MPTVFACGGSTIGVAVNNTRTNEFTPIAFENGQQQQFKSVQMSSSYGYHIALHAV
jgi:hypothetical protein